MASEPTADQACCYYLRVSQPTQRLEHQRDVVLRFCDDRKMVIPDAYRYEDQGGRRHRADKREAFQRLLTECQRGVIKWVLVAAFDRWGTADTDEFFDFRIQLRRAGVKLWSVQDQLELTGVDDGTYWRVVGQAMASSDAMKKHAERNISKMIQMARGGWHASGAHPYGTDLICCSLADRQPLYRLHLLRNDSRTDRVYRFFEVDDDGVTLLDRYGDYTRMPPRDHKTTGYRLAPSIDESRIEAVRMIFALGDEGLNPGRISDQLYADGILYFGKPFGANAIDTILRNPAYIGLPSWGKVGTGFYRQAINGRADQPQERGPNAPRNKKKALEDRIVPIERVFDPIVDEALFERVQQRLAEKPTKERPRRRDRRVHPLNGLVFCPDCGSQMVASQATNRRGEIVRYFICGSYSKSRRKLCRANSVSHASLDLAADRLLKSVTDTLSVSPSHSLEVSHHRVKQNQSLVSDVWRAILSEVPEELRTFKGKTEGRSGKVRVQVWRLSIFNAYEAAYALKNKEALERLQQIDVEIHAIGDKIEKVTSPTLIDRWNDELQKLEAEKQALLQMPPSALECLKVLEEEQAALFKRIQELETNRKADLWQQFIERVEPVLKAQIMRNGETRTKVTGFRFTARKAPSDFLGSVLEIDHARRGTGSAPRPA